MSTAPALLDPHFTGFSVSEETYKTVSSHEIKAAILIPETLPRGLRPVIVNVHGGYFAAGHSLYAPWFNPSLLELAKAHGAIIISADYRLLPTANGLADQLEDLEDFWQWTRSKLPMLLKSRDYTLDFNRLILAGGSAGGYYALQLALSHPDEISLLMMYYPNSDPKDEMWVTGPSPEAPSILQIPPSEIPPLETAIDWVNGKRGVVTSRRGFEAIPYCVSLTVHVRFTREMFEYGSTKLSTNELPYDRIKAGSRLPRNVWVAHGDADSIVYLRQTLTLVELIKKHLPHTNLRLDVAPGEDHAYDQDPQKSATYIGPAMPFIANSWLE